MSGLSNYFPRQDVPESQKDERWLKSHLDYAESVLKNYDPTRTRMTRLMNDYNGVKDPASIAWLTQRYGQLDKAPFITYRLGKTKIDLVNGEWLRRPLVATVTTVNQQALSEKAKQYDFLKGSMIAKKEVEDMRKVAGIDVMDGVQIPENEDVFETMNFKEKAEDLMQIIIEQQIKKLEVKYKLAKAFLFCELTNYSYAQVELDQEGRVKLHTIDPRDMICEFADNDDYGDESPVKGCRRVLAVHQILLRYELTKDQRDTLDSARANPERYTGVNGLGRGYMRYQNGDLMCDVIHIEWDSVTPMYERRVPKTPNQKLIDPEGDYIDFPMETEKYQNNKEFYDNKAAKEGWQIITKYRTERYEATRIGGLIDVNMRKVVVKRSIDKPSEILSSTYIGYVHGRINGATVSLQQLMENYNNLYDITRFMMNRELAKVKGKILTIDRAGVDKGMKIIDMLYRMVNDQILEYDSSAAGNLGGRQLDPAMMFKEIDLGLSQSFQQLLLFKQDLRQEIDMITGISDNRMGFTAASSTATAQQSDISNSRTITEGLFYGFSGFTKRVLLAIVNKSAISWAYYQPEEGQQVLGIERYSFLMDTIKELPFRDYGLDIEDGSKYMELSQKIESLMEVSLNSGGLRPMDALNVMLAETLAQKRQFLENGWAMVTKIAQEQQQAELQAKQQMNEANLQTQLQIAEEDREDKQAHEERLKVLEGQIQMQVDDNKAQNDMHIDNMNNAHEINLLTDAGE